MFEKKSGQKLHKKKRYVIYDMEVLGGWTMKMKLCAVSLSLPLSEGGESMGALKEAVISEEIRVFQGPVLSYCRRVQKGRCDGRSSVNVLLSKACLVPSQ